MHRTKPQGIFPRVYAFLTIFLDRWPPNHNGEQLDYCPAAAGDFPRRRRMWRFCNTVNNFRMDKKCAQLWQRLSAALKPQISADSFKRWFSTVELVEATEKSITLSVPNNIYQLWIESNYMPALQNAIIATLASPRLVKFCGSSPTGAQTLSEDVATAKEVVPAPPVDARPGATVPGLNPRNTFESFVVGPNNEIAHAASLAVAQAPAR